MAFSLSSFAGHLTAVSGALVHAEHEAIEQSCKIVEKAAKEAIGTYQFGWKPLKTATVERKGGRDTPLLETGEMRDSIQHMVQGGEGYVGSNSKIAVYQELGTKTIPARSVLGGAARHKEVEVREIVGESVMKALTAP